MRESHGEEPTGLPVAANSVLCGQTHVPPSREQTPKTDFHSTAQ